MHNRLNHTATTTPTTTTTDRTAAHDSREQHATHEDRSPAPGRDPSPTLLNSLIADYLSGDIPLPMLAERNGLSMPQLVEILDSPTVKGVLDAMERIAIERARKLAALARAASIEKLNELTTRDPGLTRTLTADQELRNRETARRAATTLERVTRPETRPETKRTPTQPTPSDAAAQPDCAHPDLDQPTLAQPDLAQAEADTADPPADLLLPDRPVGVHGDPVRTVRLPPPDDVEPDHAEPPLAVHHPPEPRRTPLDE